MQIARSEDLYFYSAIAIMINNKTKCTLIVFLPGLAVSVRRLHDTGHSGWLYLLLIIPILGSLFLLYFFVSDSAPEENRYGKSPKYAQETF